MFSNQTQSYSWASGSTCFNRSFFNSILNFYFFWETNKTLCIYKWKQGWQQKMNTSLSSWLLFCSWIIVCSFDITGKELKSEWSPVSWSSSVKLGGPNVLNGWMDRIITPSPTSIKHITSSFQYYWHNLCIGSCFCTKTFTDTLFLASGSQFNRSSSP